MHPRRALVILAAAAGLAAAPGCTPPRPALPKPTSEIVLELNRDKSDTAVTIGLHQALRVMLPPPLEKGYAWEIVANNTRLLPQTTLVKSDAAGRATVTFLVLNRGRSILRFAAVKPGESEATPTDLFQVLVGVREE